MSARMEPDDPDRAVVEMFMRSLDVDERVATALVDAGFFAIEEVACVPLEELMEITEITQTFLLTLRERARQRLGAAL